MSYDPKWAEYSCLDAAVTYGVWEAMQQEPNLGSVMPWYQMYQELYNPCLFMATNGLLVDRRSLEEERDRVAKQAAEIQEQLNQVCGIELNANSPQQCNQYFYGILGEKPYLNKEGNPTTDDKALARLARKGIKAAKLVQQIRGLKKLSGTYLEMKFDEDGRIRCSVNLVGAYTGRLSTSQTIFQTGGNMQNLPPEFRRFIVADPGMFFIEMDKAKSEWVITAYAANDQKMISAIESGIDVHAFTGHLLTGVSMEVVKHEEEILGKTTDEDGILDLRKRYLPDLFKIARFLPRSMSIRQAGKKTNHACNYIMGYREFALQNEIPETDAKPMVAAYSGPEGYNQLPKWWDRTRQQLIDSRVVHNLYGRPYFYYDLLSHDLLKAAVSAIPQGTNAEMLNRALIKIYNDSERYMAPLQLGMQVHDSILWQFPKSDLRSAALAICRVRNHMEPTLEANGRSFVVATDAAVGYNWGDSYKTPEGETVNPLGMRKLKKFSTDPIELEKELRSVLG